MIAVGGDEKVVSVKYGMNVLFFILIFLSVLNRDVLILNFKPETVNGE